MERRLLGETPLDLTTLERLLRGPVPRLALDPLAEARVLASRRAVEAVATAGHATYGINTGFGKLSSVRVPDAQLRRLQLNLVRSHAAGVGPHLDRFARCVPTQQDAVTGGVQIRGDGRTDRAGSDECNAGTHDRQRTGG